jgi:hypothetical protein
LSLALMVGVSSLEPTAGTFAAALPFSSLPVAQTSDIRVERVQLAEGKARTTLAGTLRGRDIVDYRLAAQAGRRWS